MTFFVYDKFVCCHCYCLFTSDLFSPRKIPNPRSFFGVLFYLLQSYSTVLHANDFFPPEFKMICRSSGVIK